LAPIPTWSACRCSRRHRCSPARASRAPGEARGMSRELLVAVGPGELRAVLVEAGRAGELRIVRDDQGAPIGDIHLGRVVKILPALPAALVEIGLDRP